MKARNLLTRGAATALVSALIMASLTATALAQDAKQAEDGIAAMTAFKGVAVNDVKASGKHFTLTLGKKKLPAVAFNTGTASKPIWNVGIYPKTVALKSAYGKAPAARLLTSLNPTKSAIVVSAAKWSKNVSALPKPVRDGIAAVFGSSAKSVGFLAGINYSFIADMAKVPGLNTLKSALGVSKTKVAVFGQVGEDLIRYLADGSGNAKPSELAKISLTALMGPIKPARVSRYVSAKRLLITFRADAKGSVKLGGQASMLVSVGTAKLEFPSAFAFDDKAKGADQSLIAMRGAVKVLPKSFGGQKVKSLALNARVTGERKLAVGFTGEVLIKNKPLAFGADLSFDKLPPQLALSVSGNMTVADVLGTNVPGIGGLAFRNAQFSRDHVSGTVAFRGVDTSAVVVRSGNKKPVLAMLHKTFDAGVYLPGIKGSVLDQAEIRDTAMIVVPKGSALGKIKARDLPGPVAETISAALGANREFQLNEGVNLVGAFDVRKSPVLKTLLGFVSIKQSALPFAGSVSTAVLVNPGKPSVSAFGGSAPKISKPKTSRYKFPSMKAFKAPSPKGAKAPAFAMPKSEKLSGMAKAVLASLDLYLPIPVPKIPGVEKILTAKNTMLRIRGAENPDTGEVIVATAIDGNLTLKAPGKTLTSVGSMTLIKGTGKTIGIAFDSTSKIGWSKAFGMPFLTLNNVGMAGGLVSHGGGQRSFNLGLSSDVKLGAQTVQAITNLVVENNAIVDISLALPGEIDVKKLPGIGKIPGINEFAFKDMGIGIGTIYGSMTWKRINVTSQVALMPVNGGMTMMFRIKDARLGTIVKQVPAPFGDLKFPATAITFSTVDLDDMALAELPRPFQDILSGIVTRPDGFIPVFDGVSLIGAVSEHDFPKEMRTLVKKMGILEAVDGPLILAGGVTDFFKATPKVALYAKLPGLKLPKNQPLSRVVSFDGGSADFFVRANMAALAFQVGVGGEMTVRVPQLDDPKEVDKLTFRGELFGSVDAVSYTGSLKAAGVMKGKWQSPFGINENEAYEDPAFIIGVDSEGAVEFGVGGNMHITTRGGRRPIVAKADFLININFTSSIPLPKKLAVVVQLNKVDMAMFIETQEALLKGVLTGPMASVILKTLPANERKVALMLQDKLRKASLYDLMQLDKIPLPELIYEDVEVLFATPGAVIPGREDTLNTMGMRSSGRASMKAMGKKIEFFEIKQFMTFAEGLRWQGVLKNMTIGGVGLRRAELDIGANWLEGPIFTVVGDTSILPGVRQRIGVHFASDAIWFDFIQKFGVIGALKFDARTEGSFINLDKDFAVRAEVSSEALEVFNNILKLPLPNVIEKPIRALQPFVIDSVAFRGKFIDFLKGNPIILEIGHQFFGDRAPPTLVEFKPVWKDPMSALPVNKIVAALYDSFFKHLERKPFNANGLNLGVVNYKTYQISTATKGKRREIHLEGDTWVLGMPSGKGKAIIDNTGRYALKSVGTLQYGLPLGPIGTLSKARIESDIDLDPNGADFKVDYKISTDQLGFKDFIHFKFDGSPSAINVSYRSTSPCAPFEGKSHLSGGNVKSLLEKAKAFQLQPKDLFGLINFKPEIKLPHPADAVTCGTRIAGMAQAAFDKLHNTAEAIANLSVDAFKLGKGAATQILGNLHSLRCTVSGCPSKDDCTAGEQWMENWKTCWRSGYQMLKVHINAERNDDGKNKDCLDVDDHNRNGQRTHRWGCNGKWNQSWRLLDDGRIQNAKGRCLGLDDAIGNYGHARDINIYDCNDRHRMLYATIDFDGQVHLKNANGDGDQCLAFWDGTKTWHCDAAEGHNTTRLVWYDPLKRNFINPGIDRVKREMAAAFNAKVEQSAPINMYRYYHPQRQEHILTTDFGTFGSGKHGYVYEKVGFPIFRTRAPGTVPLFRYLRQKKHKQNYLLTTDAKDLGVGRLGFVYHSVAGYVYPTKVEGTRALHRYGHADGNHGNYIFTTDFNELGGNAGRNGYKYEGVIAYVPFNFRLEKPFFNARFYLDRYADLKKNLNNDMARAEQHWLEHGIREGRQGSAEFSALAYTLRYPDLAKSWIGPNRFDYSVAIEHYHQHGQKERRDPRPVSCGPNGRAAGLENAAFDPCFYVNRYPNLKNQFRNDLWRAARHWVERGVKEGLQSNANFDIGSYIKRHPDLVRYTRGDHFKGLEHWFAYGHGEKRDARPFNCEPKQGIVEFDACFYVNHHPDLKRAFGNDLHKAADHFYRHGMREGRQSSATFHVADYLHRHQDLKGHFGFDYAAAFRHWHDHGRRENRNPRPWSDREGEPPLNDVMIVDYAGHCLDVNMGDRNGRGARRIVVADCHGGPNQRFTMHGNGQIKTINDWCLDPQEHDDLWAYRCTGNPGMKYRRKPGGVIESHQGRCLDVFGNDSRVGQKVKADRCHGQRNQKFTLVRSVAVAKRMTPAARNTAAEAIRNAGFAWSSAGAIGGKHCVNWQETADPHTWGDNFLCTNNDLGIRWNNAGPIGGMKCTQILETADPHTWHDNFLCVPTNSPWQFSWSNAGRPNGKHCIQITEAAEPPAHTWHDNYLCVDYR